MGHPDRSDFRRLWRNVLPAATGTVMEIGCGVGRITHTLDGIFAVVHASDPSPGMFECARRGALGENVI